MSSKTINPDVDEAGRRIREILEETGVKGMAIIYEGGECAYAGNLENDAEFVRLAKATLSIIFNNPDVGPSLAAYCAVASQMAYKRHIDLPLETNQIPS